MLTDEHLRACAPTVRAVAVGAFGAAAALTLWSCSGPAPVARTATVVPAPPPPVPPPVPYGAALGEEACEQGLLPAGRSDGGFAPTPELADGDAIHARVLAMPLGGSGAASAEEWLARVDSQVADIRSWAGRAEVVYIDAATTIELERIALLRAADLFDDVGTRLLALPNPFPAGSAVELTFRGFLELNACLAFCRAWRLYRVLASADPTSERASAQLRDYGDAFDRGCAAPEP